MLCSVYDRLCGLVVRVSGYRYRGPGFDSRRYQIFWVVVGLERDPLSLVSLMRSIEELLEWKSSGSRYRKQRSTAVGTRCAEHVTPLYPQKLALTSPTGGGRYVGIVRVRTKATEFFLVMFTVQFKHEQNAPFIEKTPNWLWSIFYMHWPSWAINKQFPE